MALSPDDRLLGEKTHYYCSSSEGEDEDEEGGSEEEDRGQQSNSAQPTYIPEPELKEYQGHCTNTGPKGVINDWRRFKQLETEKREEQERERKALLNKLSMTCRTQLDDEKERKKDEEFLEQIEKELEEFEDEFLKEYRQKRIEEMRRAFENIPKFGKVVALKADQFVEAIDQEQPTVTVIVHIFEDNIAACEAMNGCLMCLAQEYPHVKFCKIRASDAKLSLNFAANGIPALLIYKKGELIGNFIRMSDELGEDFFATDVEGFLHEHGFLSESGLSQAVIKKCSIRQTAQDSDSDFDLD